MSLFGIAIRDIQAGVSIVFSFLTILSIVIAYRVYRDGKLRKAKENVVYLTRFYKENILDKIGYIQSVFSISGLEELLSNHFNLDHMVNFDEIEIKKL